MHYINRVEEGYSRVVSGSFCAIALGSLPLRAFGLLIPLIAAIANVIQHIHRT